MRFGIRTRLGLGFAAVLLAMMAMAGVGIHAVSSLSKEAHDATHVGARLNAIGLEICNHNLEARRFERDFLFHIKARGVEDSKKAFVPGVFVEVAALRTLAREGLALAPTGLERRTFASILTSAETYEEEFRRMVQAVERRGHVDSGAEGSFRKSVHAVESALGGDLERVEVAMLRLRRSEKDYLLRGHEKYVALTLEKARALRVAIDEAPATLLSAGEKTAAKAHVDEYVKGFETLVEADRQVLQSTSIYTLASETVSKAASDAAEVGRLAAREAIEDIEAISWTAAASVLWISLGGIFIGLVLSIALSGSILRPIARLTQVANRVSLGDLSVSVEVESDDEIGALAESFSRMVTAVKFFRLQSGGGVAARPGLEEVAAPPVGEGVEDRVEDRVEA